MTTELPDPPWRVLGKNYHDIPEWWTPVADRPNLWRATSGHHVFSDSLIIIDHPRNDPEAVAIISAAQQTHESESR